MYLVIGANGYLGRYLIKNILSLTSDNIIAAGLSWDGSSNSRIGWEKCDITKDEDLDNLYNKTKNDRLKILFLAAYHHPDLVDKNPKIAWNVNVVALARFLGLFDNIETFYYPSTEVVYGEMKGKPFTEASSLSPVSRYGELKSVVEKIVNIAGFNVVRLPVLIGPSLCPNKKHFYDKIVDAVKNNETVEMFSDQLRSMIDFDTAAKIIVRLIETPRAQQYPVVNVCGDEALSKYELGIRICHSHGLDENKIKAVSMDSNPIFQVKRAKSTLMDNSLLKKILNLDEIKMSI